MGQTNQATAPRTARVTIGPTMRGAEPRARRLTGLFSGSQEMRKAERSDSEGPLMVGRSYETAVALPARRPCAAHGAQPRCGRLGIYSYPLIYATLVNPEVALVEAVQTWARQRLGHAPRSVLDPACGPGKWLAPFAQAGAHVAGVDIELGMVQEARKLLWLHAPEILHGDMRELPLRSGPFELAVNFYSSVSHLPDVAAVEQHLRRVHDLLTPEGFYFLGLTVHEDGVPMEPDESLLQAPPTPIPGGGVAAVHYSSGGIDAGTGREIIRILLLSQGVAGVPEQVSDEYSLLLFPAARLHDMLQRAGFTLLEVRAMRDDGWPVLPLPLPAGCGDVTLILQRRR